jgi:hypothetical protein
MPILLFSIMKRDRVVGWRLCRKDVFLSGDSETVEVHVMALASWRA